MISPEIEKMLGQYPEGSLLEITTARSESYSQESFAFAQLMVTREDLGTARQEKKFDYGNFILERVNVEYRKAKSEIEALTARRTWSLGRTGTIWTVRVELRPEILIHPKQLASFHSGICLAISLPRFHVQAGA